MRWDYNPTNSGWWIQTWLDYVPFHIWDVILPIDELHHFSRWLKPPTRAWKSIIFSGFMWNLRGVNMSKLWCGEIVVAKHGKKPSELIWLWVQICHVQVYHYRSQTTYLCSNISMIWGINRILLASITIDPFNMDGWRGSFYVENLSPTPWQDPHMGLVILNHS